ncbi:hypothetical protein GCM10027341_01920 [Spirosoma knui]
MCSNTPPSLSPLEGRGWEGYCYTAFEKGLEKVQYDLSVPGNKSLTRSKIIRPFRSVWIQT